MNLVFNKTKRKFPVALDQMELRKKLKFPLSFLPLKTQINQISLKCKKKKSQTLNFPYKNLSLIRDLDQNLSNQNILSTPSTVNENPPVSLEILNESLVNYYENEVNRMGNSITPVPNVPKKVYERVDNKRSATPTLRVCSKIHKNAESIKSKGKTIVDYKGSLLRIAMRCGGPKIRFFSRRERKSPELDPYRILY